VHAAGCEITAALILSFDTPNEHTWNAHSCCVGFKDDNYKAGVFLHVKPCGTIDRPTSIDGSAALMFFTAHGVTFQGHLS
jgi:hypothetical protein